MEVSGQLHAPVALPRRKEPPLAWSHCQSERCGIERNLLLLQGIKPVAIPTELFRLRYVCCMYVFVGTGFPMHRDLIWSIVRPL
jgi:hypothetical protein